MSEALKAIYRRLNDEAWNEGNLDLIDDLVSPDFVGHGADGTEYSVDDYKNTAAAYRAAYPDLQFATEQIIAEANTVAAHWTFRGTHTGPGPRPGQEPTGKAVTDPGMGFYRFEGEKIAEMWVITLGES